MTTTVRMLLISGSTRPASTNTAALRTVHRRAPAGIVTVLHEGPAGLPAFNPDDDRDPLPPVVAALRREIGAADAVLFCAPEYAGTLPGSFKNLLDWTVGGEEMYRKPVAWVAVAPVGRGVGAEDTLRIVLGYVGATVLPSAGARVEVPRDAVGPDGLLGGELADRLAALVTTLAGEVRALGEGA